MFEEYISDFGLGGSLYLRLKLKPIVACVQSISLYNDGVWGEFVLKALKNVRGPVMIDMGKKLYSPYNYVLVRSLGWNWRFGRSI